jgi:hypothetical protein
VPEKQDAIGRERLHQPPKHRVARIRIEVDQDIAAEHGIARAILGKRTGRRIRYLPPDA